MLYIIIWIIFLGLAFFGETVFSRINNKEDMKIYYDKRKIEHTADLVMPSGQIVEVDVKKATQNWRMLPDLVIINLQGAPIGRWLDLRSKGCKLRWCEGVE